MTFELLSMEGGIFMEVYVSMFEIGGFGSISRIISLSKLSKPLISIRIKVICLEVIRTVLWLQVVIATSGVFIIPFIRELNTSFGSVSCSKESMEIALRNGKGLIHVLIVGGAMEAMNLGDHKDVHTLYLEKRKGFIKMAIRTGVDLIPSFTFGENKLIISFEHPLLKKIQLFFERIFGFVPLIFFGRGIFQYSFGFLPLRVPLHVVIGKPIPVIMDPNPSIEMIENLHRIYVNDLKELYDKYNPLYGDANVKLVIS
ncbi:MOGAT1 [Lepeophtheirus salmonis]|uniref:diacylglycerol O-acyltransferase n=1 Tax=Lepeophtheirus salmonis TaxID=72036 RepID=A0A7R8D3P3_LEPSM|nr:MOGAT1 [Lepeophtheirus salmonis]CAF2986364.1 MOGAT1 [Lepeophtheirus salmonis]